MASLLERTARPGPAVTIRAGLALLLALSPPLADCARPAPPAAPNASTPSGTAAMPAERPRAASAPTPEPALLASSADVHAPSPHGVVGVPQIDAAMKARLRRVFAQGARAGMRADVFAKVGDSITESGSFLQDIGHGWFELGPHADLSPTVAFFHRTPVDRDGADSFARPSVAAVAGWTSADAIEGPAPDAVLREITAVRPAFALVMLGTNDVDRGTLATFAQNLRRIVDECESQGVIPVLSTIPRREDTPEAAGRVPAFNDAVRALATERALPLMDLHAALEPLPRHGLGPDGIHPSAYTTASGDVQAADLRPEGLRHGYNVRNLLALETLARLRSVVIEDGAPDR